MKKSKMRRILMFSFLGFFLLQSCRVMKSHEKTVISAFRVDWKSIKSKISQDSFKRAIVLESRPAQIKIDRHNAYAAYTLVVNEFNDTVQIIHPYDNVLYKIKNSYSFKNVSIDSFEFVSQLKFINSFNSIPSFYKLYIGYLE